VTQKVEGAQSQDTITLSNTYRLFTRLRPRYRPVERGKNVVTISSIDVGIKSNPIDRSSRVFRTALCIATKMIGISRRLLCVVSSKFGRRTWTRQTWMQARSLPRTRPSHHSYNIHGLHCPTASECSQAHLRYREQGRVHRALGGRRVTGEANHTFLCVVVCADKAHTNRVHPGLMPHVPGMGHRLNACLS